MGRKSKMSDLTQEEKAVNYETISHIIEVRNCLNVIIKGLIKRGEDHDRSKLEQPELDFFVKFTSRLKAMTYGSDEYKQCLSELKPALDHHYSLNRHHPEFHESISNMNLIDIIEMFCDWKAATKRHADGDMSKSIAINKDRFCMSDQLTSIFNNTVELFE
jgi:hypothetical protein